MAGPRPGVRPRTELSRNRNGRRSGSDPAPSRVPTAGYQFLSVLHVYTSLTDSQRFSNKSGQESSSDAATERAHTSQLPASSDDPSAGRRALTSHLRLRWHEPGVAHGGPDRVEAGLAGVVGDLDLLGHE